MNQRRKKSWKRLLLLLGALFLLTAVVVACDTGDGDVDVVDEDIILEEEDLVDDAEIAEEIVEEELGEDEEDVLEDELAVDEDETFAEDGDDVLGEDESDVIVANEEDATVLSEEELSEDDEEEMAAADDEEDMAAEDDEEEMAAQAGDDGLEDDEAFVGGETEPNEVVGAPNPAFAELSSVRWILPGPRELDPNIFGTPQQPLGTEDDVGVALDQRLSNEAGDAYTTTAGPTPHSDRWADVSGEASVFVEDVTARSSQTTRDEIDAEFTFTSPDGEIAYRVVVQQALPALPGHENFGGVGLNVIMHGRTGIGTKLQPQQFAYVTFWGVGQLYRDGELIADNRLVHFMLTEDGRNEDYELVFDADVNPNDYHAHLILPPVEVTPDGPAETVVPTGFMLENGQEQPFLHIMYDDVETLQGGVTGVE